MAAVSIWGYRVKIIRCVDGDTVDVEIDLGFQVKLSERLRLAGIDTPERGQKNYNQARQRLEQLLASAALPGGYVICKTSLDKHGRDRRGKFGRPLIEFFDKTGESINQKLVAEGLAKEYHGGKK